MDNEVMELIDELYSMVSEAWGVPLGNDKCIVERDKVLNMIEDIKAQLPVELSEAKRLVSARGFGYGKAFLFQIEPHQVADVGVVIYQQDALLFGHRL